MKLTDAAKNLMLDAIDESVSAGMKYGSLHTAYSVSGGNELTGGSPAYARKPLTWPPASTGLKTLGAALPVWDVPAGSDIAWIGTWDAVSAGNFVGMGPNGAGPVKRFVVPTGDLASDTLECPAHGFSNGDTVVMWAPSGGPGGLTVGSIYFVVSAGTDTLKLSASSGGSAIDVTSVGSGLLQKVTVQHFAGQGTLTVASLSLEIGVVA